MRPLTVVTANELLAVALVAQWVAPYESRIPTASISFQPATVAESIAKLLAGSDPSDESIRAQLEAKGRGALWAGYAAMRAQEQTAREAGQTVQANAFAEAARLTRGTCAGDGDSWGSGNGAFAHGACAHSSISVRSAGTYSAAAVGLSLRLR